MRATSSELAPYADAIRFEDGDDGRAALVDRAEQYVAQMRFARETVKLIDPKMVDNFRVLDDVRERLFGAEVSRACPHDDHPEPRQPRVIGQ